MGILSHIDRGVRELTNRVKALAGFREKGSGQASLPELLLETMGSIFRKAWELAGAMACIFKCPLAEGTL